MTQEEKLKLWPDPGEMNTCVRHRRQSRTHIRGQIEKFIEEMGTKVSMDQIVWIPSCERENVLGAFLLGVSVTMLWDGVAWPPSCTVLNQT
jgi:hypothetical protein